MAALEGWDWLTLLERLVLLSLVCCRHHQGHEGHDDRSPLRATPSSSSICSWARRRSPVKGVAFDRP
jgi:hypothetical protein